MVMFTQAMQWQIKEFSYRVGAVGCLEVRKGRGVNNLSFGQLCPKTRGNEKIHGT